MAIEIYGKIYRNLQEQVAANTKEIENLSRKKYKHNIVITHATYKLSFSFENYSSEKITTHEELYNAFYEKYGNNLIEASGAYKSGSDTHIVYAVGKSDSLSALAARVFTITGSSTASFLFYGSTTLDDYVEEKI